ncbi:hypothetical protein VZT92_004082 [Zoarces viviparus]|uniref:Uncharacterized protein n=1 Tax=Zoarces viviparus TaxID=48416 RepID=A0AAW1FXA5_ZOAVI
MNCVPSQPESISWERGVGPWGAAVGAATPRMTPGVDPQEACWMGHPHCWRVRGTSGKERSIAPMLLGFKILEERAFRGI